MNPRKRRMQIRQHQKRQKKRKILSHGIRKNAGPTYGAPHLKGEVFDTLKSIYANGLTGPTPWEHNVQIHPSAKSKQTGHSHSKIFTTPSKRPETFGDQYIVELLAKPRKVVSNYGYLKTSRPNQLHKIFIELNPNLTPEAKKERISFYRKNFPNAQLVFVKQL